METLFFSSGVDMFVPEGNHNRARIGLRLLGANPEVAPEGRDRLPSVSNYLLGNDPSHWIRGVSNHSAVIYPEIYPGIDLIFHGSGYNLEHDFRISPGADPARLRFSIVGAHSVSLAASGDLEISLPTGTLVFQKPVAYQTSPHARDTVKSSFVLNSDGTVQFQLGPYDKKRELVIDPVFSFSTYLAGSNADDPTAVTSDSSGNLYITGFTSSSDFPILNGVRPKLVGSENAFISKLDPTGHSLIYSTYLGGSSANYAAAIAIDLKGNIIVAGTSSSNDFPHAGSIPSTNCQTNDNCFFVASLTPDGSAFNYSGLIGGIEGISASGDYGNQGRLALDSAGNAYLAGVTDDSHFEITSGTLSNSVPGYPYDSTFVLKVSPKGALDYSTIVPGTEPEDPTIYLNNVFIPSGIAVDINGQVTVAGTSGPGLPTTSGVIAPTFPNNLINVVGASAGFVLQLNATASAINYATYVPGTDDIGGFAVDTLGDFYLTGGTSETTLPVSSNAYQKTITPGKNCTCNSGFLLELDGAGKNVLSATYLEGTPSTGNEGTVFRGIALDSHSNVFVGGMTGSADFPMADPFVSQWVYGNFVADMVIAEMTPDLSSLLFGSFLSSTDQLFPASQFSAVAVDHQDNLIVVGQTATTDFPTTAGSFQPSPPTQGQHGFIVKLNMTTPAPSVCLDSWNVNFGSIPARQSSTQIVHLTNCGTAPLSVASLLSSAATVTVQDSCGTIAAGSVCPVSLTYTPADSSAVGGTLTLKDNAVISPQVLNFSGQGVAPKLSPSSGTFDFGHLLVNTAGARNSLLFLNSGNASMSITSASVSGDFSISQNFCLGPVSPSTGCTIAIIFSPTAAGVRTGTLTIFSNDPVHPQASFSLTGTGDTVYAVPAISSLASPTAEINNGSITVQVAGTNFYPASVVQANGITQATTYSSGTQLQATLNSSVTGAIGEVSISVSNPTPGGGTSAGVPLTLYQQVNIDAAFLTSVPGSNLLYASIPSSAPANPNTVIPINPLTGALGTPIPVGHNPGVLAPSSDGNYLFVAANQDQTLQRINLSTGVVDRTFSFPPDSSAGCCGALSAEDLKGLPGSPTDAVLAVDYPDYGLGEMALYNDAGLVNYVPAIAAGSADFTSFTYAGNPLAIYALPFPDSLNPFFNVITVSAQGLQFTPYQGANYGTNSKAGNQVVSDGTLLYTNSGEVWNPATQTQVGTLPVTAYYDYPDDMFMDLSAKRIFLIAFQLYGADSDSIVLSAYDPQSLDLVASLAFPAITPPDVNNLTRWGSNGFAFLGEGSSPLVQAVYLLTSSLATSGTSNPVPQLVSVSPSSIPQDTSGFQLTLKGQGFIGSSVVMWNESSLQTTYSGSVLTASVPAADLANSGTASITVTNPAPGGGTSDAVIFTISPLLPLVSFSPSALNFPSQSVGTPSVAQTIAVQNTGTATLSISGISIEGDNAAAFQQTNSCGGTLSPGAGCSVSVVFTPATTGPETASVSIANNASSSPQSVPVSGNGMSLGLASSSAGSTSAMVAAGASATYNLSIGGAGFAGTVTMSCSGAPAGVACSVPATVNLSATAASPLTVTVTTTPRTSAALISPPTIWFSGIAVFGLLALPGIKNRRPGSRRLTGLPLFLLMVVCSCGGGSTGPSAPTNPSGTPAGQYTLTLTATAGSTSQSIPLKLTVQ